MNSTSITTGVPVPPWLRTVALLLIGNLVLVVSAKIQVPFWPVPMTLQTGAALLLGVTLGWRLSGASVLAYLVEGAAGLPVFATGGGLSYLSGPTGGYLVGFLVATVAVGRLMELGAARRLSGIVATLVFGDLVIMGLGVAWLAILFGPAQAVASGLLPFAFGEATKIALVSSLVFLRIRRNRTS